MSRCSICNAEFTPQRQPFLCPRCAAQQWPVVLLLEAIKKPKGER